MSRQTITPQQAAKIDAAERRARDADDDEREIRDAYERRSEFARIEEWIEYTQQYAE